MNQEIDDRIRRRAYELWVQNGQPEGHEMDFWFQAEREIKGEEGGKAPGESQDPASRPDSGN